MVVQGITCLMKKILRKISEMIFEYRQKLYRKRTNKGGNSKKIHFQLPFSRKMEVMLMN